MSARLCPYCRAPTLESEQLKPCPSCDALHHSDCWNENGGCAVLGCASGPQVGDESSLPPVLPPIEESGPTVDVELGSERRFRPVTVVLLAVLGIVVVAGVGAGAALVVNGSKDDVAVKADATPSPPTSQAEAGKSKSSNGKSSGPEPASSLSDQEVEDGAAGVLNEHHELLKEANGDPNSPSAQRAFELLSDRKREYEDAASSSLSGEQYWITKRENENLRIGQAVCLPGTVDLQSPSDWDSKTGVAFVYADFGTYAGGTWVKYEDDHWTYDAGYGHVPERTAVWEGAANESDLFSYRGGSC